jgi:tRNA (guanine37-N1)-methyltransferase
MKRFHIVTIFPEIFDSYLGESLFKRAREKKIISVATYDLRTFSRDRHRKVDDRPFGGGPGMVFKIQPIYDAVEKIKNKLKKPARTGPQSGSARGRRRIRVILFSTRGKKLDAAVVRRFAKYDNLIFICGRYEGVDERVAEHVADEEISIGDYILSGGELPALVTIEAVSRFVPGFLGKEESLEEVNGSFPTYTRPEVFMPTAHAKKNAKRKEKQWAVPKILLSGDHKKIEEWRNSNGSISS